MGECKNMEESTEIKKIKNFSLNVRKNILEMAVSAGASSAHFGGALSIIEVLAVLYEEILDIDLKNPKDRFILSKGHASLALYCTLFEKKIISLNTLNSYGTNKTKLMGHVSHKVKGVEFSTGSLGHGLNVGVGMAKAAKLDSRKHKIANPIGTNIFEGQIGSPISIDLIAAIAS